MKYFAVVLLLVAAVSADEWTPKALPDLLAARKECVSKLSVPSETLEQYKTWNFPDDELTRSYVTCIFKEFGLFCDHEGFHTDRLITQFQTAHGVDIKPKIDECVTKTDADTTNEIWVFRAFKCFTAQHFSLVQSQLTKKTE
ncbi:hypothetical protein HA402_002477 [Bradysia odoriphaga]|uniref:Odorant-binding protein 23 n=1 Tax=Bradysia odoriphaga TaxID=1564500 RepID=A0A2S0X9I1_9DIPT|nr:odorant-binding protein 23 [Bradysia odoriphaga]KAG4068786.1 hypothetical protein HA402_002477 [Bradysia odoriphaga]